MNLPFFWIDAFSDRAFGGNPAGVVPLESWLEDSLMQRIAGQNGLSETAFFVRTGPARAQLRWFTPTVEVDLCGHATLASAHVLFSELGQKESPMIFDSKSGPLSVTRKGDKLELDFPSRPASPAAAPKALIAGLSRAPALTFKSERMWLCVYETAEEVVSLASNDAQLATLLPGRIIVTAPGRDCDFVSRFFVPDAGIAEDPATGSSHCTLVPYWAERLRKTSFHARQVSKRGGEFWCELDGDRVRIAGKSACYLKGTISL